MTGKRRQEQTQASFSYHGAVQMYLRRVRKRLLTDIDTVTFFASSIRHVLKFLIAVSHSRRFGYITTITFSLGLIDSNALRNTGYLQVSILSEGTL